MEAGAETVLAVRTRIGGGKTGKIQGKSIECLAVLAV
jgi:hypothetical protein